ncbi:cation:proton antiporter [Actinosynnema sp. CA-248983]
MHVFLLGLHTVAVVVVLLLAASAGRAGARLLRQPPVIGEIVVGLLIGPLLVAGAGPDVFAAVLPAEVRSLLKVLAEGALVLYLVGVARELRAGPRELGRRVAWVIAGAFVPAALTGVVLAVLVLANDDPAVRGTAPVPALVAFLAVAMSITAVPVLARILRERGLGETTPGRLSMTAAVVVDVVGWLLLSVAVGLASDDLTEFLAAMTVLLGALCAATVLRRVFLAGALRALCARWPGVSAILLGGVALAAGYSVHALGLTAVFGAVMVGLSVPPGEPWGRPVEAVTRAGGLLLPVFFVTTGLTVLVGMSGGTPWPLLLLVLCLGLLGKIGGGYLGARLAGCSTPDAVRVGVLLDTRGLTELIVLQVGYEAGILTPVMFLALLVMALVTTALTGPLLALADRVPPRPDRARSRQHDAPRSAAS